MCVSVCAWPADPTAQTALVGQRQGVSTCQGVVHSAVPVATLFMQLSPPQRAESTHNWAGLSVVCTIPAVSTVTRGRMPGETNSLCLPLKTDNLILGFN